MKVLIVGDAVVSTGFARCTHALADRLHESGDEVTVLGINHHGNPRAAGRYPYPIYPCLDPLNGGRDEWGSTRYPALAREVGAEIVVILQDPWNIPDYLGTIKGYGEGLREAGADWECPLLVGWLAVDAANQDAAPLADLDHVVVWTDFAAEDLRRGGYEGPLDVVPLGVDPEQFRPADREASRRSVVPEQYRDAFIVGVVGRNQPRKRVDLSIRYFARWAQESGREDAALLLHTAPTGERGCDVKRLARYYGLAGRVILSEPAAGAGWPVEWMRALYNSMDVYLTTTQGEGWGLPTLEAMACGVPCVVPDWSGLGSWVDRGAIKVPCTAAALNAPINRSPYTIAGVPDERATARALDKLYQEPDRRRALGAEGRELASTLTWERTGREMREVLMRAERQASQPVPVEATA